MNLRPTDPDSQLRSRGITMIGEEAHGRVTINARCYEDGGWSLSILGLAVERYAVRWRKISSDFGALLADARRELARLYPSDFGR